MDKVKTASRFGRFTSEYGMLLVLLMLCAYYSFATWKEQYPSGREAAVQVVDSAGAGPVLVVAQKGAEAADFADQATALLRQRGIPLAGVVQGDPADLRAELDRIRAAGQSFAVVLATREASQWTVLQSLPPEVKVVSARSYYWPDFLKKSNLLAVADRIVVIAIIAIGMTAVIITGGIDLSVGSLIALSAVLCTLLIKDLAGGASAGTMGMVLCCAAAVLACALAGMFTGIMVTIFAIPPFIVTLAMMLVASGLAFIFAKGQSIYDVPASIGSLGRGSALGIPNTVALMAGLYLVAHLVMTRTVAGRYVYAVGGNIETARLSGVPVRRVLVWAYAVCGLLAGLGGVVQASQLQSGAPTYGVMYELYVIAAVVVGGTSLSGGQGTIVGTLIGAFIIGVIQNGMNLTGVESYTQKVILGLVILGAVLLDTLKKQGPRIPKFLTRSTSDAE